MPGDMLLTALAGCSGIDVANILAKQRQRVDGLEIEVRGSQNPEPPWTWEDIQLHYIYSRQRDQRAVGQAGDRSFGEQVLLDRSDNQRAGADQQQLRDSGELSGPFRRESDKLTQHTEDQNIGRHKSLLTRSFSKRSDRYRRVRSLTR